MSLDIPRLLKDPAARRQLSPQQLAEFLEHLKGAVAKAGKGTTWDSPADMAVDLSHRLHGIPRWNHAKHLDKLNEWLVDLYHGRKRNLLVSFPPRMGKTELIVFWNALWRLHKQPDKHIMFVSHTAARAEFLGSRVRNFILEHGGEIGLSIRPDQAAKNFWMLESGGSMRSVGVMGHIRGNPADILLGDDLVGSLEEANSETQRKKLLGWWQGDALNRLEPGGSIALIGSRYHEDDIMGRLEKLSKMGMGRQFDVYKLCAVIETDEQKLNDPLGRDIGDVLWPERWPYEELMQIKAGMFEDPELETMNSFIWGAVYQQDPTPEEGAIIKPSWWKFYHKLPDGFDDMIQSWDLAFKGTNASDHVVGQVWGRDGANFYLLDQTRGRMGFVETLQAIRNMSEKWPDAGRKLIEDAANGPAVIASLSKEIGGLMPVKTAGTDKASRLFSVSHLVQSGNVFLPEFAKAPWINEFMHEVAAFRADADNAADDQVDAFTQALRYFLPAGKSFLRNSARDTQIASEQPKTTVDIINQAFHKHMHKKAEINRSKYVRQQRKLNRSYGIRSW